MAWGELSVGKVSCSPERSRGEIAAVMDTSQSRGGFIEESNEQDKHEVAKEVAKASIPDLPRKESGNTDYSGKLAVAVSRHEPKAISVSIPSKGTVVPTETGIPAASSPAAESRALQGPVSSLLKLYRNPSSVEKLFGFLDKEGTGLITREAWNQGIDTILKAACTEAGGGNSREEHEEIFRLLDTDGSGKIEVNEFRQAARLYATSSGGNALKKGSSEPRGHVISHVISHPKKGSYEPCQHAAGSLRHQEAQKVLKEKRHRLQGAGDSIRSREKATAGREQARVEAALAAEAEKQTKWDRLPKDELESERRKAYKTLQSWEKVWTLPGVVWRNIHTHATTEVPQSVLPNPPTTIKPEHITAQIEFDRDRERLAKRKIEARRQKNRKKLHAKEDDARVKEQGVRLAQGLVKLSEEDKAESLRSMAPKQRTATLAAMPPQGRAVALSAMDEDERQEVLEALELVVSAGELKRLRDHFAKAKAKAEAGEG